MTPFSVDYNCYLTYCSYNEHIELAKSYSLASLCHSKQIIGSHWLYINPDTQLFEL